MQYRDSRQEVTGLVVNKKVNVRCDYRKIVRAMAHRLFTTGSFDFEHTTVDASGVKVEIKTQGTLNQLHGMFGFIDSVDIFNRRQNPPMKGTGLNKKEEMYRRFLMFKEFYAARSPILICEGKTDNVYIANAIHRLSASFPELATKNADGVIKLGIRRFKYSGSSTERILGIHGGSADLAKFIRNYHNEIKTFKAPGMEHPVIILIDNDDGAPKVFQAVKELLGNKPTGLEPFVFLFGNVYLVATPLNGGTSSCIEDYFDAATKGKLIDGKPFSSSNNYDKSTHYGKSDFAHKIVVPNAAFMDFSGFASLLKIFVDIIADNKKKQSSPS